MSFYINYNSTLYFLDATTNLSVNRSGSLTSHPTADKKTRSDNYVKNNPTASYSGVITDIITPSSLKRMTTLDYIIALEQAMDSQSAVGFKHTLGRPEEFDWFITNFSHSQTPQLGYGGTSSQQIIQSFKIDITLEKAVYTDILEVAFEVPKPEVTDDLQQQTSSSSLAQEVSISEQQENDILRAKAEQAELEENARYYADSGQYSRVREIRQEQLDLERNKGN